MPKITIQPQNKGLVQETGSAVVATPVALQTLTGNDETITMSSGYLIPVDAGGGARTGTILSDGVQDGHMVVLQNRGDENIDFAAAVTSKLAGADGAGNLTLLPGSTVLLVWDGSAWNLASQTLS